MSKWYKKISLFVVFLMLFSNILSVYAETTDYSKNWANNEISKWLSNNVAQTNDKGEFKPADPIKRIDMAILLNRLFNYQGMSSTKFSDIGKDENIADDVSKAVAAGNFVGNGGKFRPNDPITRQEAVVVFARAFSLKAASGNALAKFKDAGKIASWSKDAVNVMVEAGYIKGIPGGLFAPNNSITRAEAVKIIDNIVKDLKNKAGTYTGDVAGNLVVNTKDVNLKDMTIKGDLYLTEGIGNGNIRLDNVKIAGRTIVQGGGENSIVVNNTSLTGSLVIIKKDGKVRVVASGSSEIKNIVLSSGAKLEENNLTGSGFGAVEVIQLAPGQQITLDGDFESLDIAADGVKADIQDGSVGTVKVREGTSSTKITIGSTANVKNFVANDDVSVTGANRINSADINANGVVLDMNPGSVDVATGVTATIAGTSTTAAPPAATLPPVTGNNGGNGGGGGGGGDYTPSITLSVANRQAYVGITSVSRVTANPADSILTFSSNNTSVATINAATGAITGVSTGSAVITVTAAKSGYTAATATFNVTVLVPQPISDFASCDYNNTKVIFEFSEPSEATSVKILSTTNEGVSWVDSDLETPITSSSTSAAVINLTPNTQYGFKLVVIGGGLAGDSNIVELTTDGNLQDFTASDWDNNSAEFTFTAPGASTTEVAAQYSLDSGNTPSAGSSGGATPPAGGVVAPPSANIQYSTDNGYTWNNANQAETITSTTTSASISGLTSNTNYIFRLFVSGGTNAGGSNWIRLTTESNIQDFDAYDWDNDSVEFTFTAPGAGTTGVAVEYSLDNGNTFSNAATLDPSIITTTTNAAISGLRSNTEYIFRLFVNGGANAGKSNGIRLTTESNLQDFTAYSWTNNTAIFRFSAPGAGTTSAKIKYSTDFGATWNYANQDSIITSTSTNAAISGLQSNTEYRFRLFIDGGANAGKSNGIRLTTESNLQDFTVYDWTNTTAVFRFSAPGADTTSAKIQYSVDDGDTWNYANQAAAITTTTTSASISGLSNNTEYLFRMEVAGGANVGYSNIDSILTDGNIQDLSVYSITNNTVVLKFSPLGAGVTSAKVGYYVNGVWSEQSIPSVTSTTTSASITGLNANTLYFFEIRVEGGNNAGYSNGVIARTQSNLQNLDCVPGSVTSNGASFTFTAPTNATSVEIIQSVDFGLTWVESLTSPTSLNATSTAATVTGLSADNYYIFQLYVVGGNYSGYSNREYIYTGILPDESPEKPAIEYNSSLDQAPRSLIGNKFNK